jgi:hypothetical protein
VKRLRLATLAALLVVSLSGVLSLLATEPCPVTELAGCDHGACPPNCFRCGCCAQVVEIVGPLPPTFTGVVAVEILPPPVRRLPEGDPRDILHVPKTILA